MTVQISVGQGRKKPLTKRVALDDTKPLPLALAETLNELHGAEEWWSPHLYAENRGPTGARPMARWRNADAWEETSFFVLDVDWLNEEKKHAEVPEQILRDEMEEIAKNILRCNVFHHTPRGARCIWCFGSPLRDKGSAIRIAEGFISGTSYTKLPRGYSVDDQARDLARFFWPPAGLVSADDWRRDTAIVFDTPVLGWEEWLSRVPEQSKQSRLRLVKTDLGTIERYNADHQTEYPAPGSGTCPICGHNGCFGRLPDAPSRWACFSANHTRGGIRGENCWTGDQLDIDAAQAGLTAEEFLRTLRAEPPPPLVLPVGRAQMGSTFAFACQALRDESLRSKLKLPTGLIELNELNGNAYIGRSFELNDNAILQIRENAELYYISDEGRSVKFKKTDVEDAVYHVSRDRPYNPVADYLNSLTWDGTERIDRFCADVLRMPNPTAFQVRMVRNWMIGACARALSKGPVKMESVLIIVGPQGKHKSDLFSVLGGEWFSDEDIDIETKDAKLLLKAAWIHEWAELETLANAKRQGKLKAFVSRQIDRVRLPYGKSIVERPRRCVFCGTWNPDEMGFLSDATGNRRYYVIQVPARIQLTWLEKYRDQHWAEAATYYRASEPWWFEDEGEALLEESQAQFREHDTWEEAISDWLRKSLRENFETSDVFRDALNMDKRDWSKPNQMRIAAILKRLHYEKKQKMIAGRKAYYWLPQPAQPSLPEQT